MEIDPGVVSKKRSAHLQLLGNAIVKVHIFFTPFASTVLP